MNVTAGETPADSAGKGVTEAKPKERLHLDYLDGLRALAALYVVLYHAVTFQGTHPTGTALAFTKWLLYGHFAVDVFIVISGFSLMLPIVRGDGRLRGGYWGFMKRRAQRILPPYYFALGLSIILAATVISQRTGTIWDQGIPLTAGSILTHLFLIHDFFAAYIYSISAPFWSIAVEWQIYFFFPLLVLGWNRWGGLKTTLVALVSGYIVLFLLRHTEAAGSSPHYIGLFALGMLGAAASFSQSPVWKKMLRPVFWGIGALFSFVAVVLICHWGGGYMVVTKHAGLVDFFVGLCTICILTAISLPGENKLRSLLNWRPLVFVGTFAYSLYLIHYPLIQLLWQYVLHPLDLSFNEILIILVIYSCPLSLLVSYIFFLGCERPFLNIRKRQTFAGTVEETALRPAP